LTKTSIEEFTEFNYLKQALQKNVIKKDINKSANTLKTINPNTQLSQDEMGKRIFPILPYIKKEKQQIISTKY